MKAKVLLIAAALLMFAASSFGQGGINPFSFVPLMEHCNGTGDFLPDGTPFYIYIDVDSDGPDATDPIAPVCTTQPDCPPLSWSDNMGTMNGVEVETGPGTFYSFTIFNILLADLVPNRVYFRVVYTTPTFITTYTSGVIVNGVSAAGGAPNEVEITSWTCEEVPVADPCTETPMVNLIPTQNVGDQNPVVRACASLCVGENTIINVGPVVRDNRMPRVTIAGATCPISNCEGQGAANINMIDVNGAWTWVAATGSSGFYQATIQGATEGCVEVSLEFLLPVEMGNVLLTPLSNSASLTWNTLSEMNVARFEVVRDGEVIGIKAANNTPTGAEYSFVDETAENGHIYDYELAVVGTAGERQVVFSGKAAPSLMNAKPTEYALGQNFPNPFNPSTTISFDIVDTNPVTLMVYNANGQLVTTLLNNVSKDAGRYSLNFDASNLTSGLYFYTVKVGNVYTATKKMMLVK